MTVNFSSDRNPWEVVAAAADAIAMGMGMDVERPHPLARVICEDGALGTIAYAAGLKNARGLADGNRVAVMGSGIGTDDFKDALGQAGLQVSVATYGDQAQHLAFCGVVEAKNYQPFDVPGLGLDVYPQALGPNAQILWGTVESVGGAQGIRLGRYGRLFGVTRKAVVNNEVLEIGRMFAAYGAATSRLEARLVAATLETPANMDDGQPVFHADHGNLATPGAFDEDALNEAIRLLRRQRAPGGEYADLELRHLVVEPELEATARRVIREAAMDVQVAAMADLPAGRWYALADQKLAPTIAVVRLLGAQKPLRVESRPKDQIHIDGIAVKGVADLGAAMLGRVGIVRGSAA